MDLKQRAREIFAWGLTQRNDDLVEGWKSHSFSAAEVAFRIAKKAGLNADKAYAMGLLHDIGRYDEKSKMSHIVLGYRKLMEEGLPEIAKVCLTHSFHPKEEVKTLNLPTGKEDTEFVKDFIEKAEYDDYDKLIQLTDFMAGSHGVTIIERRFCSVLSRHGIPSPRKEIIELYKIKHYFDKKCGMDIYRLFEDELSQVVFRGTPGGFGKIENDDNMAVERVIF